MLEHPARDQLTCDELMTKMVDLAGQRFGRWLVIEWSGRGRTGNALYRCLCDCGTERSGVAAGNLKSGISKSCGCLNREIIGDRSQTHGQSHTSEYRIWQAAKKRCTNPAADNYERYGGRGVTFGFPDFAQFIAEVGPRPSDKHSLDRIDNAKGYEPGNVRWATMSAQCRNKRNNHLLTFRGKTQCMTAWGEELGLSRCCIKDRLKKGWSVEEALSTPPFRLGQKRPSKAETSAPSRC